MLSHAEFRSDAFQAYPDEEAEINPGRFGKRLAEFLKAGLDSFDTSTGDLIAEDWGWILPIVNPEFSLFVGVGNYEEYPDGFLVFIEPSKPRIRRLPKFWKTLDVSRVVSALQAQLNDILEASPDVRDLKWSTAEEFNHPVPSDGA